MEISADRMSPSVRMVHEMEARIERAVVDTLAELVGRKIAEELAADVYRDGCPALQLTPRELALLAEAQEANGLTS